MLKIENTHTERRYSSSLNRIMNFEYNSHIVLVFPLLNLNNTS